jgi:hypothetical protein
MSIIRVYNSIKNGSRMINLTYVSSAYLNKNIIKLYKSNEREGIFGTILFFGGGDSKYEQVVFNTEEDAKKEWESITSALQSYYSR